MKIRIYMFFYFFRLFLPLIIFIFFYIPFLLVSRLVGKELYNRVDEINCKEYRENRISPLVKLAPLPTSAQFLNVIESVFSGMARAIIHNSDYNLHSRE